MANNEWTDKAASSAARDAERREVGGAVITPGGPDAPATVNIPGEREPAVTPGREANEETGAPRTDAEPAVPGKRSDPAPEIEPPVRGATAEEAPELLGERSDYPIPFGEDPGTI
jgi:hypothetical protein